MGAARLRDHRRDDRVRFLRNDVSGGPLIVLTLSLVVYAVHVPMLIGFTVARYAEPRPPTSSAVPIGSQRTRSRTSAGAAASARSIPSRPSRKCVQPS